MQSFPTSSSVAALILLVALASSSEGQEGREIARNAFPSVVLIVADNGKAHRGSLGSGFFVHDDLVVTNYHVVKGSLRVRIKLVGQSETYSVQVVATSAAKDLALLRVVGVQATPLSLGDVTQVAIGDDVYAIGNPEGLEATLSQGIVSGIRQSGGNRYFQISAPISHGSSGGPILNKSGEVIGVAVGALKTGQNLNFAIPISDVAALMNQTAGDTGLDSSRAVPLIETTRQPERELQPSLYVKEKVSKAIDRVRQQPTSADAHFALAETYRGFSIVKGMMEKAIEEYKRVVRMKPDYAAAYFGLAECYRGDGIVDDLPHRRLSETSITYYKQAIRIDPDYAEAHVGLGKAFKQLDRFDEAIAAIRLAIRIKPNYAAAYDELGWAFRFAGRYDEAIEAYKTAAALDPQAGDYWSIGEIYKEKERYEQAIASYQQALRFYVGHLGAYYGLVECYAKSGRLADGIAYFKSLVITIGEKPTIDGDQTRAVAHYALGLMYAYSGDTKAALEQYKFVKSTRAGRFTVLLAEELFGRIYK
jgi:tetratricopeptide (TPR) repeat protein